MFFIRIKSKKSTKSIKGTKRQTSDFLPVRCFYAHKNAVFLFHTQKSIKSIKSTKSIKITKTQISEQATFLNLDVFMCIKCCLFYFCSLVCVLCFFLRAKSSCKKKIKRFKSALILPFTILLWCYSKSFRNEKSKSNLTLWI